MNRMVKAMDFADLEQRDEETGLYAFMLAAVGGGGGGYKYDLGTVFHLIQARPGCLTSTCDGAQSRKRRRYE